MFQSLFPSTCSLIYFVLANFIADVVRLTCSRLRTRSCSSSFSSCLFDVKGHMASKAPVNSFSKSTRDRALHQTVHSSGAAYRTYRSKEKPVERVLESPRWSAGINLQMPCLVAQKSHRKPKRRHRSVGVVVPAMCNRLSHWGPEVLQMTTRHRAQTSNRGSIAVHLCTISLKTRFFIFLLHWTRQSKLAATAGSALGFVLACMPFRLLRCIPHAELLRRCVAARGAISAHSGGA